LTIGFYQKKKVEEKLLQDAKQATEQTKKKHYEVKGSSI
jgi:hypothetical protein